MNTDDDFTRSPVGTTKMCSLKLLEAESPYAAKTTPPDPDTVRGIKMAFQRGVHIDPILVVEMGRPSQWFVVDGLARVAGAIAAGKTELLATIYQGTPRTAAWLAAGCHSKRIDPRSKSDIRRAIRMAMEADPTCDDLAISLHCGVAFAAVKKARTRVG